jgi:hypothetical protein
MASKEELLESTYKVLIDIDENQTIKIFNE